MALLIAPSPSRFWRGVFRIADPKITLASVASLLLGAAAAAHDGPLHWGWLALSLLGIFFLEAAKNASGEIFDWDSGDDQAVADEDRSPFSGGKRVLVDGLMSRRALAAVAAALYALGVAAGLCIVALREPRVLWLGLAGVGLAFFYHAPPLRLAYRGLGELAVATAYGPLISLGAYLVQRGTLDGGLALLSLPLSLLIAGFLWINEFPDYLADRAAGKRTLVVRLGRLRASRAFALLEGSAFALLLALPLLGVTPWALLGLAGLPVAAGAALRLARHPEVTREIIPAQGRTLLAFVLYAAGAAVGLGIDALGH